jgi:hypothetical protein
MKNLFAILLVLLLFGCNHKSEKAELESQIESLTSEMDSLVLIKNQLEIKLDSINRESNFWFDNETQGRQFLEMGIKNPKEYITSSILHKPELIPLKPILGGQMKFMQVEVLGKECLIAYYEDGHASGRAIYSYKFNNGGLEFKLITTYEE